eukprot:gene11863-5192_t
MIYELVLILVNSDEIYVGYVLEKKKNKIDSNIFKNIKLEKFTCTPSRIQKSWKKEIETEQELMELLHSINLIIEEKLKISFDEIKPGKYNLSEICEFLKEKDEIFLFIQILKSDKIKRKGDVFIVLSQEEVKAKQFQNNVKRWNLENEKLSEEDRKKLLDQLLSIFDKDDKSEYWQSISHIFGFKKNPISYEVDMKILFDKLNYKISWDEFYIQKNKLNNNFNIDINNSKFKDFLEKNKVNRKKYTTNTFTIDSSKTKDFDDAFTIVNFDDGFVSIIVHITDIASYLEEFPEILNVSKSRMRSVYLLDKIFPMMPKELSENIFSLKQNEEKLTISYEFLLTKEKVELKNIHKSFIVVQKNLNYNSVQEEINEYFWKILSECCENIQKRRLGNSENNKEYCEECLIDISDRSKINIKKSERRLLKSNLIINELSILVNSTAGIYLKEKKIPCIFKNQSKYSIEPQDENDLYIQCTSPIRRFSDLLNQYQILSSIENRPSLSKKDIENQIPLIQSKSEEIANLELKYKKYWILTFLSQNENQIFNCQIVHIFRHCSEVKFLDYSFNLPVHGLQEAKKGEIN